MSQHMDALARANKVRVDAAHQRRSLIGQPVAIVVAAIIAPPPELASLKLRVLFVPRGNKGKAGLIPAVGPHKLQCAFGAIIAAHPLGRQVWHTEMRLRDLTEMERCRLARALVAQAPRAWREAA